MRNSSAQIALVGYSGHAYVVFDTFFSQGLIVSAYTETEAKKDNPFALSYLGNETAAEVLEKLRTYKYFVCLGDNVLRRKVSEFLLEKLGEPENALHKSAIVSRSIDCGSGVLIAPRVVINARAVIGNGVICNSGCIIEHECRVGNYTHIAPGAVLCGNVTVGENTLIGAGSVVKPGVRIGNNVTVGAGSVVLKDIADGMRVAGNPVVRI